MSSSLTTRSTGTRSRVLRVAFFLVLAIALIWFLRSNWPMVMQAYQALSQARPGWVILAVVVSLASLFAMADVMYLLLSAGGVPIRRRQAATLTFGANAWSTTLPGGPALSTVLQFQTMRSWGASVVVISWFVLLSSAIHSMWLVLIGLGAIVFLGASFSLWSLIIGGITMAALAAAIHWASANPRILTRWSQFALRLVNRVLRRDLDRGAASLEDHMTQLGAVQLSHWRFALVTLLSGLNRLLDLATLWCSVIAVTGYFGLETSNAGVGIAGVTLAYATAKIVGATGITPGGIGPVEAALTATLIGVGLSGGPALAAALVYRLISFVFVTLIGWVVYAVGMRSGR